MTVVSAFLIPGSPLPLVHRENPPWGVIGDGLEKAAASLRESNPDTICVYSTQWIAVLDQLWLTKPRVSGIHVDENWHEYGELTFDFAVDTELTLKCAESTGAVSVKSKGVDYDHFPVDTGTIVASNFLNPKNEHRMLVTSNNLYHDWEITTNLGKTVARQAQELGRRIAIVGVGGLSGRFFRESIDITADKIATPEDDQWNQKMLELMEIGDTDRLLKDIPQYEQKAMVDMGFKHFAFLLGALGSFSSAKIHAYGPLYGTGAAVIEYSLPL